MELIRQLWSSTSFGLDGIDANFLKLVLPSIVGPVRHIINVSLLKSTWANKWKLGKILPQLKDKDADRMTPSSYRPVCLLSTLSKIVEKAAQRQLQDFLEETKQINPEAHAYRRLHSTTTTIVNIADIIYQAADNKEIAQMLTIDQSAAFDLVDHEILVRKLKLYNISTEVIKWIQNYLGFRSNVVSVGGVTSHFVAQNRGVPQGSIIGPLLYSVFVNELSDITRRPECKETVHLDNTRLFGPPCTNCGIINTYADDSTYVVTQKKREDNQTRILEIMDKMKIFCLENGLHLNEGKTTILENMVAQKRARLPGSPPQLVFTADNGDIKEINDRGQTRILGINFLGNMTWLGHLETGHKSLLPSIRRQLGALQHLGRKLPFRCRNFLAEGLIVSRFCYLLSSLGIHYTQPPQKGTETIE